MRFRRDLAVERFELSNKVENQLEFTRGTKFEGVRFRFVYPPGKVLPKLSFLIHPLN